MVIKQSIAFCIPNNKYSGHKNDFLTRDMRFIFYHLRGIIKFFSFDYYENKKTSFDFKL